MATLVLTVIGNDTSGLVDALADPIARHGGSWDRSHMARLAGQFAGIVVVSVPDDNVTALQASLDGLNAQGLLDVQVAIASSSTEDVPTENVLRLELIGQDRPGIISEISAALATRNVSILELETNTLSAPMSGEPLFEAKATLRVPNELPLDQLRETLEDIANELMVDLDLRPE
ncbi:glycine cleavage system protein R [uncultured Ilumatobacter sp.]|jgi:glycine cleavage system regulatory protein|uniref:glycine cleavage system protein R n=1 Tax=Ilumatobacter sp. TaxID=1967498 RepID=UPI0030AE7CA4|tara:strand:- start:110 stop:634 length:525 start_codon:yes stop_codon:yes gene_type:complete